MSLGITQVDAFATTPFSGNPAAVCILDVERNDAWMQSVALEMNLSETAFLLANGNGWKLRWFTPVIEVDLCGHATLASAHVLWSTGLLGRDSVAIFETRSGRLEARRDGEFIVMDFPAEAPRPAAAPAGLTAALGVEPVAVLRNRFDYLVEVESAQTVRSIRPDFTQMRRVEARGVMVTARADDGEHDFISRFFAPNAGVDEDPVTGSAHCCLAPYWAGKLGRSELLGYQASTRGGTVGVKVAGNRVLLRGRAITVMTGELTDTVTDREADK